LTPRRDESFRTVFVVKLRSGTTVNPAAESHVKEGDLVSRNTRRLFLSNSSNIAPAERV
jgi:hypothetical protein